MHRSISRTHVINFHRRGSEYQYPQLCVFEGDSHISSIQGNFVQPMRSSRSANYRTAQSNPLTPPTLSSYSSNPLTMDINAQGSGGPTTGGIHFPGVTQIFRHHPARPAPRAGPAAEPSRTIGGYVKYFSAGAICATVTHVSVCALAPMLTEGNGYAN